MFHVVVVLSTDPYLRVRASAFLVALFDVLAPDELNTLRLEGVAHLEPMDKLIERIINQGTHRSHLSCLDRSGALPDPNRHQDAAAVVVLVSHTP